MNPEEMINRLSGRLSLRRRVATVVALLGGLAVAAVVGLLLATEPDLPPRTRLAFAAIVVVGLAWAAYGVWALTGHTPLFARDRVIAAWLALAATGLLAVPVAIITVVRHRTEPAAFAAAAVLPVLAAINLIRARARRSALLRRKRELGG
jgi:hypothetical protein